MTRICTISARGGSKGVKNKNVRQLLGKPLIAHTLEQAQAARLFDFIAVSSDSEEILEIAQKYGADLLVERPLELAGDSAPKLPAINHCVEEVERRIGKRVDVVTDLDVTSPLRLVEDIQGAVSLLEQENISNVFSVSPARRSPYFNLVELDNDGVVRLSKPPTVPIVRRQDSPACFDINASIYVWRRSALFHDMSLFNPDTQLFVMPEERSIDIDNELDFQIVDQLMRQRLKVEAGEVNTC